MHNKPKVLTKNQIHNIIRGKRNIRVDRYSYRDCRLREKLKQMAKDGEISFVTFINNDIVYGARNGNTND